MRSRISRVYLNAIQSGLLVAPDHLFGHQINTLDADALINQSPFSCRRLPVKRFLTRRINAAIAGPSQ